MGPGSGGRTGPAGTNAACARRGRPTSASPAFPFAARRPGADEALALAPPGATAASTAVSLAQFARELAPGVHAVFLLDRAGWHVARRLAVPDNVAPVPLPAHSPGLDPVERAWLHLR